MGKGRRIREERKRKGFFAHAAEVLTRNFQKEIRNSEFWPMMVAEFGEKKAEELLKECRGELKPGFPSDEVGHRPTDL